MIEWKSMNELVSFRKLVIGYNVVDYSHGPILPEIEWSDEMGERYSMWAEIPTDVIKVKIGISSARLFDTVGIDHDALPSIFYDIAGFNVVFGMKEHYHKVAYFNDSDHLYMAMLKYPEIFVGMEVVDD